MVARDLNPTEFANLVNAITSAFGDPTRRDIYLMVQAEPGSSVAEVAERTGLHPNVARHHLDKLVGGGYVEVGRRAGGGAGRPAKTYSAVSPGLALTFDVGHDDILVTLLGKALSRLDPVDAAELAEEVGEEFGRKMAAELGSDDQQRSFRSALHVVADALSAHGFAAHAHREGDELRLVAQHCPFGDVAVEHPVICAVDRGMVRGLLGAMVGETLVELSSSVALGDDQCVAVAEPVTRAASA